MIEVGDLDGDGKIGNIGRSHMGRHLEDIGIVGADRRADCSEDPAGILGADVNTDLVMLILDAVPGNLDPAQRIGAQEIAAIGLMDRDTPSGGDKADDRISRHRAAALADLDQHAVDAVDADPRFPRPLVRWLLADHLGRQRRRRQFGRRLFFLLLEFRRLQSLHQGPQGNCTAADLDQHIIKRIAVQCLQKKPDMTALDDLAEGRVVVPQLPLADFATEFESLFLLLLPQPVADPRSGPAGLDEVEPAATRPLVRRSDDLDDISGLQMMLEWDQTAIDLGADAVIADLGVDGVGEIDGAAADRQFLDLAAGGEGEDIRLVQFAPDAVEEFARIFDLVQRLDQLLQFAEEPGIAGADLLPFLVGPMGGNPFLGHPIHLFGTDLDLDEMAARPDNRSVHRLVVVGLGRGDEILDPPRNRRPVGMNDPQGLIALADRFDDDAEGHLVVDSFQGYVLDHQLLVDRIEVLRPADDSDRRDIALSQLVVEDADDLVDIPLPLVQGVLESPGKVGILLRMQVLEGEVLQFPFHPVDADTTGQGRIQVHRLPGLIHLGFPIDGIEQEHILQAIDQLHQEDPDVSGNGEEQLADVLGLARQLAVVLDLGDAGRAVDDGGDIVTEFFLQFLDNHPFLQHPVQQSGQDRIEIEVHGSQHRRDVEGVHQVRLARKMILAVMDLDHDIPSLIDQ